MNKIEEMSTNELKLQTIKLENKHEVLKFEINNILDEIAEIDKEYNKIKNELNKRNGL